jgi:OmpA-OmpF porin, OOP family
VLVLIYRLLLLGVSGGLAFLAGIAIASIIPGTVEEPPFVERLARRTEALITGSAVKPIPTRTPPAVSSVPTTAPSSPSLPAPPAETAAPETPPPLNLSDQERDRLQAELDQLETDVQSLRDRAADLESELGSEQEIETAIAPLEQRIQQLQQRLDPDAEPAPVPPPTPAETPEATAQPSPLLAAPTVQLGQRPGATSADSLMVTLPLDVLFATDTSTLPPQTTAILDSVVGELVNYPGAAIQVAAHADDTLAPAESRLQSFEQAKAVQTYLASLLNEEDYHWVVVGYGQTYPVVQNATPSDRQRNRRLEMTINPR